MSEVGSRELLDAVLAAPDDDAPRLVYADYLIENGAEARGELIIAQCAIAQCEAEGDRTSDRYRSARAHAFLLYRANRLRWLTEYGIAERSYAGFERGFVTTYGVDGDDLEGPTIQRLPLRTISLYERASTITIGTLRRLGDVRPAALQRIAFTRTGRSVELDATMALDVAATSRWPDSAPVWVEGHPHPAAPFIDAIRKLAVVGPWHADTFVPRQSREVVLSVGDIEPSLLVRALGDLRASEVESLTLTFRNARQLLVVLDAAPQEQLRELTISYSRRDHHPDMVRTFVTGARLGERLRRFSASLPVDASVGRVLAGARPEVLRCRGGGDTATVASLLRRRGVHTLELDAFDPRAALDILRESSTEISDVVWHLPGSLEDGELRELASCERLERLIMLQLEGYPLTAEQRRLLLGSRTLARVPWILGADDETLREPQ